jgi:hypothetical protein
MHDRAWLPFHSFDDFRAHLLETIERMNAGLEGDRRVFADQASAQRSNPYESGRFRRAAVQCPRRQAVSDEGREAALAQNEERTRHDYFRRLAEDSLRYLQLQEALGAPPELSQLGRTRFAGMSQELRGDVDRGWAVYSRAIASVLEERSRPQID